MTSHDLSFAISELYAHTIATGRLTPSHRRILMEALCSGGLQDDERTAIDRVIMAARHHRLVMVDE